MAYDLRKWSAGTPVQRHRATASILVMLLAVQCVAAVTFVFGDRGDRDGGTLLPGIVALAVAMSMSPFARDRRLGSTARTLDEFETQAIARGTRTAYSVLLTLTLLLVAWMWAGAAFGWTVPTSAGHWQCIGLSLLFTGATLPIALTEWMVPVPSPADEPEDEG